jgi:hypothetical protein
MRPRIARGTLVGSTNPLNRIKARRMIIEVLYNFRTGVVKERKVGVRETIEQ